MLACVYITVKGVGSHSSIFSPALKKLSREITMILAGCAPAVERWGLQGWFLDLTGCDRLFRKGFVGWGAEVLGLLKTKFGVDAQMGIASNKVTAEMACRLAKPGVILWLFEDGERVILNKVSIDLLPRLTSAQREIFRTRRLQRVVEAKAVGEDNLRLWLGNREGSAVWRILHGICNEPVEPWCIPRLLKKSYVFTEPTACRQDIVRAGTYLTGALYHESRKCGTALRKVSCRLIYADDLETIREVTMAGFSREEEYVSATARMLESLPLRRVQVKTLHLQSPLELEPAEQQDLFSEAERLKRRGLNQALKDVREKYGAESVHRAGGTPKRKKSLEPSKR